LLNLFRTLILRKISNQNDPAIVKANIAV